MSIFIPAWILLGLKILLGLGVLFLCVCGVMFILVMKDFKMPW